MSIRGAGSVWNRDVWIWNYFVVNTFCLGISYCQTWVWIFSEILIGWEFASIK